MMPNNETTKLASSSPPPEFYNNVFDRLVGDADHQSESLLSSLVAYGLYKLSKRQWLLTHKRGNDTTPAESDYRTFAASQTDEALEAYRARANQIVALYANTVMDTESPKLLKEAVKGSFWRAFWPSFLATVIFTALIIVIVLAAALNGIGLPIQISVASPP